MPYYDKKKKKWIGEIQFEGERHRGFYEKRQAAKDWERDKRRELQASTPEPKPTDMELRVFFSTYLDYAELKFSPKTFQEKQALLQSRSLIPAYYMTEKSKQVTKRHLTLCG